MALPVTGIMASVVTSCALYICTSAEFHHDFTTDLHESDQVCFMLELSAN